MIAFLSIPNPKLGVLFAIILYLAAVSPGFADVVTLEQAVEKTFEKNPYIQIEKETVTAARGDYQSSLGEFDWLYFFGASVEHSNLPIGDAIQSEQQRRQNAQNTQISTINSAIGSSLPLVTTDVPSENREDVVSLSTGVTKKLKSGVTLTPSAAVTDFKNNTFPAEVSRSDVRLKIIVPILRGAGTDVTTANLEAAATVLETARFSSYHNISKDINTTIVSFYNCLAAQQSFKLVQESFTRAEALLVNVTRMVEAGMLEPAFLNQATAKLYNTRVDVKDGEIFLYETRQALGLSMGMDAQALVNPPLPLGDFPSVADLAKLNQVSSVKLLDTAKDRRMDYRAALESIKAERILLKQAENHIKPRLDLTFQLGYAGLSETSPRSINSFYDNVKGAYGYAGLNLEFPFENNYARGRYRSRASALASAGLSAAAAFNAISSEILIALENVKMLVTQHDLASKSAERYKAAVAFEKTKYDAGESTLNALIDIEDRYIDARLTVIETRRRYAVALARLKFVTGTLLERENDQLHFHVGKIFGPQD